MSICGKLSIDLITDCNYPLVSGVVDRAILANFDDVVISYDVNGIANDIVITTGRAYVLEGKNSSIDVKASLIESRFAETYDHVLMAKIFNNNGLAKKQIEDLSKGRFIAIVENNYRGLNGQSSFEIFGANVGLELKEATQDKSDSETQGAWTITLGSNENFREPLPQASFFSVSYAGSKAKIEALLAESEIPSNAVLNEDGTQPLLNEDGVTPLLFD